MTEIEIERPGMGLSSRGLAAALFGKYLVLAIYGIWAAIVELPTFVLVGSGSFATAWATSVAALAILNLFGIARTWTTGYYRAEKWLTAAFVCVFLGYSFALVWRAVTSQNWDATPTALIPVAVCILPAIRFFSLLLRGRPRKVANR